VRTVAKGLVRGLTAAAKSYCGAPRQSEGFSFGVDDLEIAFDTKRTVMIYDDSGCRQFVSPWNFPVLSQTPNSR
jgi:hypothetical protein